MTYDMSDDLIREMVERNHRPEETILRAGMFATEPKIFCQSCLQNWPCEARNELRAWEVAEMERQTQENFDSLRWHRGLQA